MPEPMPMKAEALSASGVPDLQKAEVKAVLLDEASSSNKRRKLAAALGVILLLGGALIYPFVKYAEDRKATLHAIPDHEVPATKSVQRSSSFFELLHKKQHGDKAAVGHPNLSPVTEPTDFVPEDKDEVIAAKLLNRTNRAAGARRAAKHPPALGQERWANITANVTVGAMLLGAADGWGPEQAYYNGAAVLLLHMCGCESIMGVILNQRTASVMEEAFCPRTAAVFDRFRGNPIYLGGPVGPVWINLHDHDVADSDEMLPGIFVGGDLLDAHDLVVAGAAAADATLFLQGYAAWPLARLQAEADAGLWTVVEAPAARLVQLAKNASLSSEAYVREVRRAAGALGVDADETASPVM